MRVKCLAQEHSEQLILTKRTTNDSSCQEYSNLHCKVIKSALPSEAKIKLFSVFYNVDYKLEMIV